jgi:hypothetical protein
MHLLGEVEGEGKGPACFYLLMMMMKRLEERRKKVLESRGRIMNGGRETPFTTSPLMKKARGERESKAGESNRCQIFIFQSVPLSRRCSLRLHFLPPFLLRVIVSKRNTN